MKVAEPGSVSASKMWLSCVLLALGLAVYLPTVATDIVLNDNQAAAASAWRIATTGKPWMEGVEPSALEGTTRPEIWLVESSDGHVVHNRTPGAILPAVPFYLALNNDTDPEDFEIWVGGVAAAVVTAVAGVLLFLGLRTRFSSGVAFWSTAVVLFATPVWSVGANALWTQNLTILAISGAILSATRQRWWLVGLFFAIGIFARAHLAVIAAVVGLYLGWRRKDWRIVVATGLSSSVGVLSLMAWNRVVFGAWNLRGGYGDYVTDNLISGPSSGSLLYQFGNLVGFFLAPDRGFFVWTPIVLVLLPSMMATWRQLPDWVRAFVLGGLLYSLVQLRMNSFQGGQGFFGYRLALELLICMVPALVYAFQHTARLTRVIVGGLAGVQLAAIGIGASADQYWVDGGDVWTSNAFLLALEDHPVAFGLITVASGLTGAVLMFVATRQPEPQSASEPLHV